MPKGTHAPDGAEAVDTAFQTCTDSDCDLPDFENVELQRLTLNFPAGAGLSGEIQASRHHPATETDTRRKHSRFSCISSGAVHCPGDKGLSILITAQGTSRRSTPTCMTVANVRVTV